MIQYYKTWLIQSTGLLGDNWAWEYFKVHVESNRCYVLWPGNKWKYRGSWAKKLATIQSLRQYKKKHKQPLMGEVILITEDEFKNSTTGRRNQ